MSALEVLGRNAKSCGRVFCGAYVHVDIMAMVMVIVGKARIGW